MRPGRPHRGAFLLAVASACLLALSCTPEEKHAWLALFFDGVPPLHQAEEAKGGAVAAEPKAVAVEANPDDQPSKAWLAKAVEQKRVRDRLAELDAAIQQKPDDPKLHGEAGELRAKLGKWPQAAAHLAEAVRLAPKDAATRKIHGLVLFRLGKMDEAVAELEACVKLDRSNADYPRVLENLKRMREMHQAMQSRGGGPGAHGKGGPDK